jgi:hypothetical protein
LKSIQKELQQRKIHFVGLHYIGALAFPIAVDDKVVKFQYDTLFNSGKWLDDTKALF